MISDANLSGLAVVVAFKNVCICQELSGMYSSQFQFVLEFRANEMLSLNAFFCLL